MMAAGCCPRWWWWLFLGGVNLLGLVPERSEVDFIAVMVKNKQKVCQAHAAVKDELLALNVWCQVASICREEQVTAAVLAAVAKWQQPQQRQQQRQW
jgi:hypothetical protein